MKNLLLVFVVLGFAEVLFSCKKEYAKKFVTASATSNVSLSLTGKWFIAKDSVETKDYTNVLPNLVHPPVFTINDFITFNPDSTVAISTPAAFSAFYTNYQASNTDSRLQVIATNTPILKSDYHVALQGYSIPPSPSQTLSQPIYALSITQLTGLSGEGYNISMPDAKTLVLSRETEIPTLKHDFKIKESVFLYR